MAKAPTVPELKEALTQERRKNKRLRAVIDAVHEGIREVSERVIANKRELDIQLTRLGHLQAEVDLLKRRG
jgi:uncharacterized coiled-coil protein SlyX